MKLPSWPGTMATSQRLIKMPRPLGFHQDIHADRYANKLQKQFSCPAPQHFPRKKILTFRSLECKSSLESCISADKRDFASDSQSRISNAGSRRLVDTAAESAAATEGVSPLQALEQGSWVKLICGASFEVRVWYHHHRTPYFPAIGYHKLK